MSVRGMLRVVQLGCIVAFLLALAHGRGWIQVGGQNGLRFPRTDVLWLAPLLFVGVQFLIMGLRYRRYGSTRRLDGE